jgi:RNA-binding protein
VNEGPDPIPGDDEEPAAAGPAVATAQAPAPPKPLRGLHRRFLRAKAQPLKPLVLVGAGGVTPAVIAALDRALLDHELVKVRSRGAGDIDDCGAALADATGAHLCGTIGHTAILYRPHPEQPRIVLPQPAAQDAQRKPSTRPGSSARSRMRTRGNGPS